MNNIDHVSTEQYSAGRPRHSQEDHLTQAICPNTAEECSASKRQERLKRGHMLFEVLSI